MESKIAQWVKAPAPEFKLTQAHKINFLLRKGSPTLPCSSVKPS